MIIPFGDHLPDLAAFGNKGSIVKNVIPTSNSYRPFRDINPLSAALSAYCQGAASFKDKDGNVFTYASNGANLYELSDTSWTLASKTGGYSTSTSTSWEFIKYNNKCIASNFSDVMQQITLDDTNFADLAGTPPKAMHIGVVRGFVVAGNTNDADGNVPHRIRWSGINDETAWTISATTQADKEDLQGNGGWVQKIVSGDIGIIFQERAIWRMTYVGSPIVFQLDQVEQTRGALAANSVVPVGNMIFYLADDGFYVFTGGSSTPIGESKINKTFFTGFDISSKLRMTGAVDLENSLVVWAYPSSGSTSGTSNRVLTYHWPSGRWSSSEIDLDLVFSGLSAGYTLEGLDAISASLDSLPASLDSRLWTGGNAILMAFDSDHKLGTFTGNALDAQIDTGEVQFGIGTSEVLEVRPLVDGGTHTVSVGHRSTQAGTVSFPTASSENSSGICPVRVNDRYHRFRVSNTGNFTDAIGVDVRYVETGDR